MKKIDVEDKTQIKQLLYTGNVFGLRNDQFRSFGGFQLWWYDKQFDVIVADLTGAMPEEGSSSAA